MPSMSASSQAPERDTGAPSDPAVDRASEDDRVALDAHLIRRIAAATAETRDEASPTVSPASSGGSGSSSSPSSQRRPSR